MTFSGWRGPPDDGLASRDDYTDCDPSHRYLHTLYPEQHPLSALLPRLPPPPPSRLQPVDYGVYTAPATRPVSFVLHDTASYDHDHDHDHPGTDDDTTTSRSASPHWRNGGSFRTHGGGGSSSSSNSNAPPQPWCRPSSPDRLRQRFDLEGKQPPAASFFLQQAPQGRPWAAKPAYEQQLPQQLPQSQLYEPQLYNQPPLPDDAMTDTAMTDADAAARVAAHLAAVTRRCPAARHERILRGLIHPRAGAGAAFALDGGALDSVFSAANALFFYGRLTRRVRWGWAALPETSETAETPPLGHTLVRRAAPPRRGFETLVRLARPLLTDHRRYGRRLLLAAFLHELIHCYLFVCCGWRARARGGHTPGFRAIAATIDRWAGPGNNLHLRRVEADLARFRQDAEAEAAEAAVAAAAAAASDLGGSYPVYDDDDFGCGHCGDDHQPQTSCCFHYSEQYQHDPRRDW